MILLAKIINRENPKSSNWDSLESANRYRTTAYVTDSDGNHYLETPGKITVPKSVNDKIVEITNEYVNRLDLVSFKYYSTPLLWWVIAEASGISDPFNVPLGTVLRVPEKSSLYGFRGLLL